METPQRHNLPRRSLLNVSMVSSPLRRTSIAPLNNSVLELADDEKERSTRRSMVAMQRRLTNITSASLSPLVDTNPIIEENQIKAHLLICTKLYTENRISAKNAWQLHVIDVMRRIALTDTANILQVAGSSLDIGAKVYGLRVDDVHAKGLQLASSMAKANEKQQVEENGELDANDSVNPRERRKNTRKKSKKLAADKRNTVDKEEKSLFGSIKHVESVMFATTENIEVSSTDNMFTQKLPTNPGNHQLMLMSKDKYWSKNPDDVLQLNKILDLELPEVKNFQISGVFRHFDLCKWDPEEEERELMPQAVLDDNGLPIAELDGSIHDIFEDNNDIAEDHVSDAEEQQQEVFQAQIYGDIAHIVDAVPEENRVQTDYGYNVLVRSISGKFIDKIWAGPSHWKVKFNRRSSSRYSGSTVTHVVKHTRKTKVPQKIEFSLESLNETCENVDKYVCKRAAPTTTFEKVTLPVPELCFQTFQKQTDELLIKPGVPRPKLIKTAHASGDYEVPVYNYENPNDSQYCSQNNSEDPNDGEPIQNSFEEEARPLAQQQFLGDNLIDAPEMVSASQIPYAMQAKKMDMRKLKNAVWKCLTRNLGEQKDKERSTVKPTQFSSLYQELPHLLTADMKKELTCPLAMVALLHLCNENNLLLRQNNNKDFMIVKATE